MSRILLIDTATEVCSAAIAVDGRVVALEEDLHATSHAALLTIQIDACVKRSGLSLASVDAVALSSGPGAYTSLRVGSSVAKGICYALGKPLIAVDTLLSLAAAAKDHCDRIGMPAGRIYAPAIDARRQEIWTALYDAELGLLSPAQPLILENNLFESFLGPDESTCAVIAGNGVEKTRNGWNSRRPVFFTEIKCSAAHLAGLATQKLQNIDFQDVAYFEPFYMKLPNITKPNSPIF